MDRYVQQNGCRRARTAVKTGNYPSKSGSPNGGGFLLRAASGGSGGETAGQRTGSRGVPQEGWGHPAPLRARPILRAGLVSQLFVPGMNRRRVHEPQPFGIVAPQPSQRLEQAKTIIEVTYKTLGELCCSRTCYTIYTLVRICSK